MKKVLFVATVDQHIRHFHIPYLKWFKEQGVQVSVATHGDENVPYVDCKHEIEFERNPWSINNLIALKKLFFLLKENKYDLIHTHTPVASILIRIANLCLGKPSKLIYTAHGFHFYKGARFLNWLLYYPAERLLSYCTDTIITINSEDYNIAKSNSFGYKKVYLVDGVGVDLNKFNKPSYTEKYKLREKYNLDENDFVLIYVGELSKRKNQEFLLNVIYKLSDKIAGLKLLLVGKGAEEERLKKQCSTLGIENIVSFLGYRYDIADLMKASDLAISTALQEGLPVNLMESLSTGLPCIVTNCRGNRDVILDDYNGYVVNDYSVKDFAEKIYQIYSDDGKYIKIKDNTLVSVERYSEKSVMKVMSNIYLEHIGCKSE